VKVGPPAFGPEQDITCFGSHPPLSIALQIEYEVRPEHQSERIMRLQDKAMTLQHVPD
jgi:hypothetical protein